MHGHVYLSKISIKNQLAYEDRRCFPTFLLKLQKPTKKGFTCLTFHILSFVKPLSYHLGNGHVASTKE
jgi:hypothetical protein